MIKLKRRIDEVKRKQFLTAPSPQERVGVRLKT
jgi:hypothetical protein